MNLLNKTLEKEKVEMLVYFFGDAQSNEKNMFADKARMLSYTSALMLIGVAGNAINLYKSGLNYAIASTLVTGVAAFLYVNYAQHNRGNIIDKALYYEKNNSDEERNKAPEGNACMFFRRFLSLSLAVYSIVPGLAKIGEISFGNIVSKTALIRIAFTVMMIALSSYPATKRKGVLPQNFFETDYKAASLTAGYLIATLLLVKFRNKNLLSGKLDKLITVLSCIGVFLGFLNGAAKEVYHKDNKFVTGQAAFLLAASSMTYICFAERMPVALLGIMHVLATVAAHKIGMHYAEKENASFVLGSFYNTFLRKNEDGSIRTLAKGKDDDDMKLLWNDGIVELIQRRIEANVMSQKDKEILKNQCGVVFNGNEIQSFIMCGKTINAENITMLNQVLTDNNAAIYRQVDFVDKQNAENKHVNFTDSFMYR